MKLNINDLLEYLYDILREDDPELMLVIYEDTFFEVTEAATREEIVDHVYENSPMTRYGDSHIMYSEESVDLLEKLVDKFETLCLLEQARCERAAREKGRRELTMHERMIQALEEYQKACVLPYRRQRDSKSEEKG